MIVAALAASLLLTRPPVRIVADPDRGGDRETWLVRVGEHASLGVVVDAEGVGCHGASPRSTHPCPALPDATLHSIRWWRVRPIPGDYDNVRRCGPTPRGPCHDPIRYEAVELPALRGVASFDFATVAELRVAGTHRLYVELAWEGEALTSRHDAGISVDDSNVGELASLVVRRDDSYVGLLTELVGAPFALGPVVLADGGHQTDRRLAADCVALVIYGRRRLGEPIPYMAPAALRRRLHRVASAPSLVRPDGSPARVASLRVGDVLDFGFQTAVIAGGLGAGGRLRPDTRIIHTYHGVAEEIPLRTLPYRDSAVNILRWPAAGNQSGAATRSSG